MGYDHIPEDDPATVGIFQSCYTKFNFRCNHKNSADFLNLQMKWAVLFFCSVMFFYYETFGKSSILRGKSRALNSKTFICKRRLWSSILNSNLIENKFCIFT